MCIIVSKEKGIDIPSKQILETCFKRNPDGAGIMYAYNNRVHIIKGLMSFNKFNKTINKLKRELDTKNIPMVFHFRIGTKGNNDKATTHPFPISNKVEKLTNTNLTTDMGMVHNGIIYDYSRDKDLLSDTQHFIKEFVYGLKVLNKNFLKYSQIRDIIKRESENTKLVFLNDKGELTYIGDFIEDKGIKYSNTTYKTYEYIYTPSKTYKSFYENDYYDNYYDTYYAISKNAKKTDFKSRNDLFKLDTSKYKIYSEDYKTEYNDTDLVIDRNWDLYKIKTTYQIMCGCEFIASDVEVYRKEDFEPLTTNEIVWGI